MIRATLTGQAPEAAAAAEVILAGEALPEARFCAHFVRGFASHLMGRIAVAREAFDEMEGLAAQGVDDVLHDQVGNPLGSQHGKAEMVQFYEALFADIEQTSVTPLHRQYGETFAVDDIVWEAYTTGTAFGLREYPRARTSASGSFMSLSSRMAS